MDYIRTDENGQLVFEQSSEFYYPKVIMSHRSKSDFVSNRLNLVKCRMTEGRTDHHQKGGIINGTRSKISGD